MDLLRGDYKALGKRQLTEETVRKFGYHVAKMNGETVQVADYKRDGKVVAQKVRTPSKDFRMLGDSSQAGFFGQHLHGGKDRMLVVVEGEIDAMSLSQALMHMWSAACMRTHMCAPRPLCACACVCTRKKRHTTCESPNAQLEPGA